MQTMSQIDYARKVLNANVRQLNTLRIWGAAGELDGLAPVSMKDKILYVVNGNRRTGKTVAIMPDGKAIGLEQVDEWRKSLA
jgi:hypothetical protein